MLFDTHLSDIMTGPGLLMKFVQSLSLSMNCRSN